MKVSLVYPPSPFLLDERVMPPLGILFLATQLEQAGHEVKILDLTGKADYLDAINTAMDSDLIGFTSTTPQYPICLRIKERLKQEEYGGRLAIGGIHPTSDPFGVSDDGWDAICLDEGERAILKIAEGKNGIVQEPLVPDLNSLGHPARHLIDLESYRYEIGGEKASTTFTQRGCVFNCSFCESPLAGRWKVRYHSPEWVKDEALILKEDYGMGGMMFFDDELNINIPRLMKICELLKPLKMKFRGFFVAPKATEELLGMMKEAGFFEIAVGLESGSPELLKNIHKPQTVDIMVHFAELAHKVGIRFKAFTIVGLPGESWDTIAMTERLLEKVRPDDLDVGILQVYPGSPIYLHAEDYQRKGLSWEIDYTKAWYRSSPGAYQDLIQVQTPHMTKRELIAARDYLEWRFKPPEWRDRHIKKIPWDRLDPDLPYVREWTAKLAGE